MQIPRFAVTAPIGITPEGVSRFEANDSISPSRCRGPLPFPVLVGLSALRRSLHFCMHGERTAEVSKRETDFFVWILPAARRQSQRGTVGHEILASFVRLACSCSRDVLVGLVVRNRAIASGVRGKVLSARFENECPGSVAFKLSGLPHQETFEGFKCPLKILRVGRLIEEVVSCAIIMTPCGLSIPFRYESRSTVLMYSTEEPETESCNMRSDFDKSDKSIAEGT